MTFLNRRDLLKSGAALSAGSLATPFARSADQLDAAAGPYQPYWNSLRKIATPQWLRDGKFGIYTHWGIYSVPAYGKNGTWYAHDIYTNPTSDNYKHHVATYGPLDKFGYKDFIPMFTGSRFDPDEWAELFHNAGARFAGPVAEHHDGFAMWNTKYSSWNAAKMGPKRDVVGELEKAYRAKGMKFMTAFHHAAHWFYFPTWDSRYDVGNPKYSGLYGEIHPKGALPDEKFLDEWKGKLIEVVDHYDPDLVWFDFGLQLIQQWYKKQFVDYYFNRAAAHTKQVTVTYKWHDFTPGVGVYDLELGQETDMTYAEWVTDTTIDAGSGWGYVKGLGFKSVNELVTGLVDRVSKNGFLLLNVGPKPDGTIPEEAKERLRGIGEWLRINGEAIYGTSPWLRAGEGPTHLAKNGPFNENNALTYTPADIRFTCRDDVLYATLLAWPGDRASITSFVPHGDTWPGLYPSEIASIEMLGSEEPIRWKFTPDALVLTTPKTQPCRDAFVYRIRLKQPFSS
ncbi:MAG TPA: alpha-L-fucosidase [Acidobacteriaceae bacterium]|jgi:alpha-L-fucosidase|nr:alpha-L-fucosidase [Acidobacteriaceae bacterium]